MADQHLLTCPNCGDTVAVGPSQAGSCVTCSCGRELDVPTLRAMRQLPIGDPPEKTASPAWGIRQGLVALCLILAVLCAIPGVYFLVEQTTTTPYRIDAQLNQIMRQLEKASPLQTWMYWNREIVPLAEQGLTEFQTYDSIAYERKMKSLRRYQKITFGAAGVAVLFAVVIALWRKS